MNLPNKLTCLRMLLVPVFVVVAYLPIYKTVGDFIPLKHIILLAIFCAASFTDYLDGHIARKRKMVTTFGKFLDPIADKLLVLAALLVLVEFRTIPAWIVIVMEGRELLVAASRMLQAKKGNVVAASMFGKVKTVSQMIAIILALLAYSPFYAFFGGPNSLDFTAGEQPQFILNILMSIAMTVAIITSILSGMQYVLASKDEILQSK